MRNRHNQDFHIQQIYSQLQKVEKSLNQSKAKRQQPSYQSLGKNNSHKDQFKTSSPYLKLTSHKPLPKSRLQLTNLKYLSNNHNSTTLNYKDTNIISPEIVSHQSKSTIQQQLTLNINNKSQLNHNFNQQLSLQSKNKTNQRFKQTNTHVQKLIQQLKFRDNIYNIAKNNIEQKNLPKQKIPNILKQMFQKQMILEKIIEQFKRISNLEINDLNQLYKFLTNQQHSDTTIN